MGESISALIDRHYPLARTCAHKNKEESFEKELDDDRYHYIIVERCVDCRFPMGDRYATTEEIARHFNER
jgi:hypothetical protein